MQPAVPPPLPGSRRVAMKRYSRLLVGLGFIPPSCFTVLVVLRLCGLIRPFYIPTGAMVPALSPGDHIIMENVTFHFRQPRRGDIVVFKTDGLPLPPPPSFYDKRIVGEPGDHVLISEGKLFINGTQVILSNAAGVITYDPPPQITAWLMQTNVTVPRGCYYLLGDNSTNSADSRFWGCVPRGNIIGRVSFCYWPPESFGGVK